jgi:sodium/potassium-transporting ATPase subunit alpha
VGILHGETLNQVAEKEKKSSWKLVDPSKSDAVIVVGNEIGGLTPNDWDTILSKKQVVFARTSPEQKLTIVEHCQAKGEIVAVTGDGVNDSPALKRADLGCAMNSGSDVSKDAAIIILMDDNFASIVTGVREGRIIFDNLKKSIAYTLSSNSAELVPFIAFVLFQMPLALSAVLILCIDLGTDVVPAISLAYEKAEKDIMLKPPRDPKKDRLVTLKLAIYSYLWLGTWQAIAGFIAYFYVFNQFGFPPSFIFLNDPQFKWGRLYQDDENLRTNAFGEIFTVKDQTELLRKGQSAFFVAVVVTRMACLVVCKTRSNSLFTQGLFS